MARLQRYALAIIDADKIQRKQRKFTISGKSACITWLDLPTQPKSRAASSEGQPLAFLDLPRGMEESLAETKVFWQVTRWQCEGKPTTWIELFALFRIWGGH